MYVQTKERAITKRTSFFEVKLYEVTNRSEYNSDDIILVSLLLINPFLPHATFWSP